MSLLRLRKLYRCVGKQVLVFRRPLLLRDPAGRGVYHCVPGPRQPGLRLPLQRLQVHVGTVPQEVLLHVPHAVLNLSLRFRVPGAAEHRVERADADIRIERLCHHIVAQVPVPQEHGFIGRWQSSSFSTISLYYCFHFYSTIVSNLTVSLFPFVLHPSFPFLLQRNFPITKVCSENRGRSTYSGTSLNTPGGFRAVYSPKRRSAALKQLSAEYTLAELPFTQSICR